MKAGEIAIKRILDGLQPGESTIISYELAADLWPSPGSEPVDWQALANFLALAGCSLTHRESEIHIEVIRTEEPR